MIELIRQFYTEPRPFRIDSADRRRFVLYSNINLLEDQEMPDGTIRHTRPMFDIQVSAEKQSPFSRAAQNETVKELYGMGLFAPENAVPALVCIDAMDFEGKDTIRQQIEQNSTFLQQFQAAMQIIQQAAMVDPMVGQMAMQAGLIAPEQAAAMAQQMGVPQGQPQEGTPESRVAASGNSYADRIRERSANAASPM